MEYGYARVSTKEQNEQHHDRPADFLRDDPPLFQDLRIVPAEAVDALDHEQVAVFQFTHQPAVLRPLEVLPRLLVHVNVPLRQPELHQPDDLPLLVLFPRRYPRVTVFHNPTSIQYTDIANAAFRGHSLYIDMRSVGIGDRIYIAFFREFEYYISVRYWFRAIGSSLPAADNSGDQQEIIWQKECILMM